MKASQDAEYLRISLAVDMKIWNSAESCFRNSCEAKMRKVYLNDQLYLRHFEKKKRCYHKGLNRVKSVPPFQDERLDFHKSFASHFRFQKSLPLALRALKKKIELDL